MICCSGFADARGGESRTWWSAPGIHKVLLAASVAVYRPPNVFRRRFNNDISQEYVRQLNGVLFPLTWRHVLLHSTTLMRVSLGSSQGAVHVDPVSVTLLPNGMLSLEPRPGSSIIAGCSWMASVGNSSHSCETWLSGSPRLRDMATLAQQWFQDLFKRGKNPTNGSLVKEISSYYAESILWGSVRMRLRYADLCVLLTLHRFSTVDYGFAGP